jgi:hypothetical protein
MTYYTICKNVVNHHLRIFYAASSLRMHIPLITNRPHSVIAGEAKQSCAVMRVYRIAAPYGPAMGIILENSW